ncbi:phosphotransferase [Streptomyces sp. 11x1]|uniref:phosphotransferase n=1 Tax=Streptomyces sp. 11x1 TaxID=3038642 RepID=UPI0029311342|nr:phosphotransferase [Streptomyces sp. 11x1]WNZ11722.1 phosphotransferase [Streptomyces sp. 11x1]
MTMADVSQFTWQRGLLRAGPLGRRIELRSTGGRHGTAAARTIDRPLRPVGRAAALFDQLVMRMRIGPKVDNPLAFADTLLHALPEDVDGMAFMHSSTPGRCVAALSASGRPRYVLKVGNGDDRRLQNEGEVLTEIPSMGLPFKVPELLFADFVGDHFVVMSRAWSNCRQAGLLSRDELLGITAALGRPDSGTCSLGHGDLAPWNILRTPQGLGIVDWECASLTQRPLRDVIHYLVQAGGHLRWIKARAVVRELIEPQGTLAQLATRIGCPQPEVDQALRSYFASAPAASVRRVGAFRDHVASKLGLKVT